MKILVTGGAGFVGSHIVGLLLAEGHQVIVVDNLSTGSLANLPKQARLYPIDVGCPELDKVFLAEQPDYVIHQAAQVSVGASNKKPVSDARTNILASLNLLECCVKYNIKKIVYASSAAVYGNPQQLPIDEQHPIKPLSGYGISKHTVEHYLEVFHQLHGLAYVALRYANIYGPRQDPRLEGGVVAIFAQQMASGKPVVIYGDGKQTRDFVYVEDIARANYLALGGKSQGIYNISWGQETSLLELFAAIQNLTGYSQQPRFDNGRPGDIYRSCLSPHRFGVAFGWRPEISLSTGLKLTLECNRGLRDGDSSPGSGEEVS